VQHVQRKRVNVSVPARHAQHSCRRVNVRSRNGSLCDDAGKMNRSIREAGGAILAVSQFTLLGDCRRGRRPSFDPAAPPEIARTLYEQFVSEVQALAIPVSTGVFQAMMDVELTNQGPVTFILDSRKRF